MGVTLYFQYYVNYFVWVYARAGWDGFLTYSADLQDIVDEFYQLQSNRS
jgi:hypothetical protein